MNYWYVILLAIVQGLAELLPVSSSAHVVVTEKLLGLDPTAPEMTLLLVMLHTGTMFAVMVYFWKRWTQRFFQSATEFWRFAWLLILATVLTGVIGEALIKVIEKLLSHGESKAWIEELFGRLELIAPALAAGGILILIAGLREKRAQSGDGVAGSEMTTTQAAWIGAVQGLCLPFRGLSRSGATISTGMLAGVGKALAEDFSFALAVILTPAAVGREVLRLAALRHVQNGGALASAVTPSLVGAVCAFLAGLLALKWLSRWLETGRWYIFGIYCLVAACVVMALHFRGF
jgi:undecaprenyl-diphosphatase